MRATCVGFGLSICALPQSSHATNVQLVVQVRTEAVLAWQGQDGVVVKVRLASGNQVKVWTGGLL